MGTKRNCKDVNARSIPLYIPLHNTSRSAMQVLRTTPGRARIMASIRASGNRTTELALARMLRISRIHGWRRHQLLPGRPDFCWPTLRLAVFVDGCFWHGCPRCYQKPRNNSAYWALKVKTNKARDRKVTRHLASAGWRVVRIWECEVQHPGSLRRIRSALQRPTRR